MNKSKLAKIIGISTSAILVIVAVIFFMSRKNETKAGSSYKAVTEEYVAETTTAAESTEVETTTVVESTEVETTTAAESTEAETTTVAESTEAETTTVADSTEVVTEAQTEAVTEAQTEAVTEVVTEAQTEAVTEVATEAQTEAQTEAPAVAAPAPQATALTDIVYSDVNGTKTNFASIEDAKKNINVKTLSDDEAHNVAVANKTTYAAYVKELFALVNSYRTANGLSALSYDDTLETMAMHRAAESAYSDWNMTAMEGNNKRHIRPNYKLANSLKEYYGVAGNMGENFGRWYNTSAEILSAWQASSSHNALLLTTSYTKCGIGVAADSYGDFYWIISFN